MAELNELIHQPARLRIMAALTSIRSEGKMDFSSLAKLLNLTDGNLGSHLLKLEEAHYIRVEKSFINRKPRTHVSATHKGRAAFEAHVAALKEILSGQN